MVRVMVIGVASALLAGCGLDLFNTEFDDIEPAETYQSATLTPAPTQVDELVVMTWNIKFGGGRIDFFFECHGDRALMSQGEVEGNLSAVVAKINELDPDVLLLQEVDVGAKRSVYIDMVQWILDRTDLNFGVYASQWKADFIPSDGIGRMDSGNAILSRWPLNGGTRIALPLVSDFDTLKSYFYLKRNMLRAQLAVPGHDDVFVVDVHTEAFSKDGTKRQQIDQFKAELDRLVAEGFRFVAGGDLNALPPGTVKLSGFEDARCTDEDFDADDFSAETDWLEPLYEYASAIDRAAYEADNAPHFTHTTDKAGFWNRKLDYLFTNLTVVPGTGVTHQGQSGTPTMPLSDHAPVTFVVAL